MFGLDSNGRDVLSEQFRKNEKRGKFPQLNSGAELRLATETNFHSLRSNEQLITLFRNRALRKLHNEGRLSPRAEDVESARREIIDLRLDAYDKLAEEQVLQNQTIINANIGQINGESLLHHESLEDIFKKYERAIFLKRLDQKYPPESPEVISLALRMAFEHGVFLEQSDEIEELINEEVESMAIRLTCQTSSAQSEIAAISGIFERRNL